MDSGIRVAKPPPKPLMVFDGDCNFCTLWIRRWQQTTGDAVDYLPAQDPRIAEQFPEIPREQFDTAVQLIEADGAIFSGAEAVFRALAKNPRWQWPLAAYEKAPSISRITESAYGFVAGHRTFFSRLTKLFWGRHVEQPDFFLTRWLFLRALGVVYLVAFVSLGTQINGLIGHNGILPADQFMSAVKQQCDARDIGLERFHLLPTLCWFDASDGFLDFQCAAGTVLALLLIAGIAPVPCLVLLWLLYLSLATIGRDFLGFQWDNLLLEAGFLAIFFAPLQLLPRPSRGTPPSRAVLWLLWLLLFKLMFSSGCVKLLSGDPNWRNLTALTFHYYTQPLPTWIGWYANQLPLWFQKLSCAAMFGIELGAPWLIFAPRRLRFLGGAAIAALQILILLTGNYTFFNLLTLALCLLLLDDFLLERIMPSKLRRLFPFSL
jgi:predicted DCC family thiol-disulfide oxidoreductase YuxK